MKVSKWMFGCLSNLK